MSKATTVRANAPGTSKTPQSKPDWLNQIIRAKQDALAALTPEETRRLAALPDDAFEREMSAAQADTAKHPDSKLIELGRQLAECEARNKALPNDVDDKIDEAIYNERWMLREKINDTPATTPEGFRVKVDAIDFALRSDDDAMCEGPGSVLNLAQSLCYDIRASWAANESTLAILDRLTARMHGETCVPAQEEEAHQ